MWIIAWIAVRNNFHQHLRIECPFAKNEIDRFINLVDETETKINVPSENDKEKNEILLPKHLKRLLKLLATSLNVLLEQYTVIPEIKSKLCGKFMFH